MRRDAVHGCGDITQIRLAVFAERRRHADDERIGARGLRVVGGGGQAAGFFADGIGDDAVGDALDVTLAGAQLRDFVGIDIESGDRKAGLGESQRQRQADIAEAVDGDHGLAPRNFFKQLLLRRHPLRRGTR